MHQAIALIIRHNPMTLADLALVCGTTRAEIVRTSPILLLCPDDRVKIRLIADADLYPEPIRSEIKEIREETVTCDDDLLRAIYQRRNDRGWRRKVIGALFEDDA